MIKKEPQTHICHECKTRMPALEALMYKDKHWYCKACFDKKANRDWFATQICLIFGLKSPGPRIYRERKKLQEDYGYTDLTIIDTLKYALYEKKLKVLSEEPSLYLVTPALVSEYTERRRSNLQDATNLKKMMAPEIDLTATERIIVKYEEANHPIRNPNNHKMDNWDDLLGGFDE